MAQEEAPKSVPAAGNASNPAPFSSENRPGKGMLDKKAEKYMREGANLVDMPDAEEDQEAIDEKEEGR
ncbi:hypothetical protein [uncultured Chitinophaga sp.]|uniref:hypothetical protein n=1 Tax=uncultured Chitinophaga sp. TaxID=339340 RepID=UPI002600FD41|nr:hypothetical protein [uncultured Chitinophaga sp.]